MKYAEENFKTLVRIGALKTKSKERARFIVSGTITGTKTASASLTVMIGERVAFSLSIPSYIRSHNQTDLAALVVSLRPHLFSMACGMCDQLGASSLFKPRKRNYYLSEVRDN